MFSCLFNGKPLSMELDTGAAVSCIPFRIYKEHFSNLSLKDSNIELKTYNGQIIKPCGTIESTLVYNNKEVDWCTLHVVKQGCKSLCGRDIISKLDLVMAVSINHLNVKDKINHLCEEFSDIFSNELGIIRGEEISLEVTEGINPVFIKPRSIPYAFKDKVNSELDKLQQQGVIRKVENSEWGTPLVPVLREDGETIRLCANYKNYYK